MYQKEFYNSTYLWHESYINGGLWFKSLHRWLLDKDTEGWRKHLYYTMRHKFLNKRL